MDNTSSVTTNSNKRVTKTCPTFLFRLWTFPKLFTFSLCLKQKCLSVFFPQVKKHFLQKKWQYILLIFFNSRKADKTSYRSSLSLWYLGLARREYGQLKTEVYVGIWHLLINFFQVLTKMDDKQIGDKIWLRSVLLKNQFLVSSWATHLP